MTSKGAVTIVDDAFACGKKERPLAWSVTGPEGPQGPAAGEPDRNPHALSMYLTLSGTTVSRVQVHADEWTLHRESESGVTPGPPRPVEADPLIIELASGAAAIEATTLGTQLEGTLEVGVPATKGLCFQTIRFSAAHVELTELDTESNVRRLAIDVGAFEWSTSTRDPSGSSARHTLDFDFATNAGLDLTVESFGSDETEGVSS